MSSPSEYLESRAQAPQWFRAPENSAEAGMTCNACGLGVIAGELIAEVDGDGMEYVHEACVGEEI